MKTLILFIFYILNIFYYFLKANDINFETFKFMDSTRELEDFLLCSSQLPLLRFLRVPFGQRGIYI